MELINNIVKGLAKVFQFFLQFLAGEEDTALHGAQREVQLFSDFAVLEAGNVHSERNSIFFRERVDYPISFKSYALSVHSKPDSCGKLR